MCGTWLNIIERLTNNVKTFFKFIMHKYFLNTLWAMIKLIQNNFTVITQK